MPFTAQTRMSGVDLDDGREIRKGGVGRRHDVVREHGGKVPPKTVRARRRIASRAALRWSVGRDGQRQVLGVIHLKDVVKGGMRSVSTNCARWASARS